MYVRVNESIYNSYAISILFDYETWGLVEPAAGGFQPLQLPAPRFSSPPIKQYKICIYMCVYDTYIYIYIYILFKSLIHDIF